MRVINHSDRDGKVTVKATDDAGMAFGPITVSIRANKTAHFNSEDLEAGSTEKGLSGGVGSGHGDWWLEKSSPLNFEALAYMRTTDGFLTSMFETVPGVDNRHRVPVFNPGGNRYQVSKLRVVNPGQKPVDIRIDGIDGIDDGVVSQVSITIEPAWR